LFAELRKKSFSQTRGDVLRIRVRIFLREQRVIRFDLPIVVVVVVCAEWKRTDESFGFWDGRVFLSFKVREDPLSFFKRVPRGTIWTKKREARKKKNLTQTLNKKPESIFFILVWVPESRQKRASFRLSSLPFYTFRRRKK